MDTPNEHRTRLRAAAAVLLAASCGLAPAAMAERFEGEARDAAGALLYREHHLRADDRHVVLYRCPGGQAFARKTLQPGPDGSEHSPYVELVDARSGRRHGVRRAGDAREAYMRHDAAANERSARLDASPPVIDAGFDAWIRDAWPSPGEAPIEAAFLAPGQLRAMPFRVQALGDDAGVRSFRLSLARWFGALAPRVEVDYAIDERRLLRFRGPSDIPDARGRMQEVDIRFPASARSDAAPGDVERALDEALVSGCEG